MVNAIQAELLAEHGGKPGLRAGEIEEAAFAG